MNKDYLIKSFEHAGRTINIFTDPDPVNPRKEYDNIATIAHWHRNYDFGRQIPMLQAEADMRELLEEEGEKVLAIVPLYLFDHSGISLSTEPFGCRWDSGQVGWVYITEENAEKMGCVDAKWDTNRYLDAIRAEVKEYDSCVRGDVYGYEIRGMKDDLLDSCWGFIGDMDDCETQAKAAAGGTTDPAIEAMAEELSERVTFASV